MTNPFALVLNALRGFLIGMAELVPGVSGGTIALVTGVYDELINSAAHVLAAVRRLVSGPDRVAAARVELRRTSWGLVIPVLLGMGLAVLTVAGVMESFVSEHPEQARGLFFGLVLVSIVVPLMMAGPIRGIPDGLALVLAALAAWFLIGLAGGAPDNSPPLVVVFFAAAVAVCALVVPGVSGSFFLLAVGLYAATLGAVDDRDLAYLAVFALGMVGGLVTFVPVLRWLLDNWRRTTLLVMAGLMAGSLRALWPWQADVSGEVATDAHAPGDLLEPYAPIWGPIGLAVLGGLAVLALVLVEARASRTATGAGGVAAPHRAAE